MNGLTYIVQWSLTVMLLLKVSTAWTTPLLLQGQSLRKEVAMGNSNGVITAPINVQTDVYKVLGISAQNGNYDIGYACSNAHGKINKWSKIKPVTIDNMGIHIKTDKLNAVNPFNGNNSPIPAYWGFPSQQTVTITIKDGSYRNIGLYTVYGLGIPVVQRITSYSTDIPKLIDALATNPSVNWPYKPVSNKIFRLSDFDGYDHTVGCPIAFNVRPTIYQSEKPTFFCYYTQDDVNQVDLQELGDFFDNFSTYVYVVGPSGSMVESIEFGLMSEGVDEAVTSQKSYTAIGTYKAYFFAADDKKEQVLLFPTLDSYPNPMTFRVVGTLNPTDPVTNPFGFLTFDIYASTSGFSYDQSRSFFESFSNVLEGDCVELYTQSSYCLKVEFSNTSTKTITVDTSKLEVRWEAYPYGDYAWIGYRVYVDDVIVSSSGTITWKPNESKTLKFQMNNIFYDQKQSRDFAPNYGETMGNVNTAYLTYNNVPFLYFDMVVVYGSDHIGYFHSSSRGFYLTR